MKSFQLKILFMVGGLLLLFMGETIAQITNLTQMTFQANIQSAIDNANPGDVIEISNGTYVIASTINVNKSLTIQGESEAGVIFDASAMTPVTLRVIETDANDIILRNFTIIPITDDPNANEGIGFTIKAGANSAPTINTNLTLENITVAGAERTPFDIHGVDGVNLINLTANNTSRGNGINITGSTNVNITGFSGMDNAWGSIAVYASRFVPAEGRGSSDVTIDGPSLAINGNVFSQDDFDQQNGSLVNTNVVVTGWNFIVTNPDFRPDGPEFKFFVATQAEADALAVALDPGSVIQDNTPPPPLDLPAMDASKKAALMITVLAFVIVLGYRRLA